MFLIYNSVGIIKNFSNAKAGTGTSFHGFGSRPNLGISLWVPYGILLGIRHLTITVMDPSYRSSPVMVLKITDNMCDFIQVSNWRYRPSLMQPAVLTQWNIPIAQFISPKNFPPPIRMMKKFLKVMSHEINSLICLLRKPISTYYMDANRF